jgi:DNA replication regulator DPB11
VNPFESYVDDLHAGKSQQEESMRVMYEDPGQQEEKKRLMRLLKGQTGDEESMGTSMTLSGSERKTRRSTRIAGF